MSKKQYGIQSITSRVAAAHRRWSVAIENAEHWRNEAKACERAGYEHGTERAYRNAHSSSWALPRLRHEYELLKFEMRLSRCDKARAAFAEERAKMSGLV